MNIKVKVSQGLAGEFTNKLGAVYEQEVQRKVDAALKDIVNELVEVVEEELDSMEARHFEDMEEILAAAEITRDPTIAVVESQLKTISDLEATLEEAETRMFRLADENRALQEKIAMLENDAAARSESVFKMTAELMALRLDNELLKSALKDRIEEDKKVEVKKEEVKVQDLEAEEAEARIMAFLSALGDL